MKSTPVGNKIESQIRKYDANGLVKILDFIHQKKYSAEIQLTANVQGIPRQAVVVIQNGELAFCGSHHPSINDFANIIKVKKASDWMDVAITSLLGNIEIITPQAFLSRLVEMHLLSWQEVQKYLISSFVIELESFIHLSGEYQVQPQRHSHKYFEISWSQVQKSLDNRSQVWRNLKSYPNKMHEVLFLTPLGNAELLKCQDPNLSQSTLNLAFATLADATSDGATLIKIAKKQNSDPLLVAQKLLPAIKQGWIGRIKNEHRHQLGPKFSILVVDDSDIVRKVISRMLQEKYEIHQASNALDALTILNRKSIDMMLLDVTMPNIDGLTLCKNIRNISRFAVLPILMITARDGFFDKVKGRMAGATEYITKPFDREEILGIIDYYINGQERMKRSL